MTCKSKGLVCYQHALQLDYQERGDARGTIPLPHQWRGILFLLCAIIFIDRKTSLFFSVFNHGVAANMLKDQRRTGDTSGRGYSRGRRFPVLRRIGCANHVGSSAPIAALGHAPLTDRAALVCWATVPTLRLGPSCPHHAAAPDTLGHRSHTALCPRCTLATRSQGQKGQLDQHKPLTISQLSPPFF
jgi:hypothetical protein